MAKKANKRPTRAERDKQGTVPQAHRCADCGHVALSKYALKEHREYCNGR
jgi:transcription elongation factor Elf1